MKNVLRLFMILCISLVGTAAFAQDIQTKGSISGQVTDASQGAVSGATVKLTGGGGAVERTTTTNDQGLYTFENLIPGTYTVRVEMTNFKTGEVSDITVFVGKSSVTNVTLQAGNISETVTVTAGADLDQSSTAVGSNLNDQLFANIPVARGVAGLFYLAPGTTDSLGGGRDNPSISGGSALDNLYVADGVNITDSAFGGIGTFSRSYGALGTGINTAFVKEVQVKTGGFEPQYGQATGGIVNIITQSGGNEFHGAVYGYARPGFFEARRKQRDDFSFNKVGELLDAEAFDAGGDIGGPVIKNKLFFFGSVNPSLRRDKVIGAVGSGIRTLLGEHNQDYKTWNYAGKVDWNLNPNHTLAFSIYGDPTKTNTSSFASLNIDNDTANSKLDFGSRNIALRYNGSLSPTWSLNASFSQANNHFDESGFADFNQIVDRTNTATGATRGQFTAIGRGFFEPTEGRTRRFSADTNKQFSFLGQHSVGIGYQFSGAKYSGVRDRSGPKYPIPATNATGTPLGDIAAGGAAAIGQPVNVAWSLRVASEGNPNTCPLCPIFHVNGATDIGLGAGNRRVYLRQDRGEYGDPSFTTNSDYHAAYVQDTWRLNKYLTAIVGFRNEQERVIGNPSSTGTRAAYSFTGNWAPRIGFTVDPSGQGKMKVYYNYGRYFEYLPLDMAERSLSAEQDFTGGRFAPQFTTCVSPVSATDRCAVINSFGTVNPVYTSASLLNAATGGSGGGITISFNDPNNPILSGTKLGFIREHVIGAEFQLPKNFVFSARYLDRKQPRIVEDAAVVSPEQANAGLFGQSYFLANIDSRFDRTINAIPHTYAVGGPHPAACGPLDADGLSLFDIPEVTDANGNVIGAICYNPNPLSGLLGVDGLPDGFPDPVHNYKAVEIELNKRFADNWQLLTNWRIAKLEGNYEGHLRNDNGQTDPGISSLFDFTQGEFNLLGDQFAVGPLNTDRRHVINVYGSYAFSESHMPSLKGLNLGFGWHGESGLPISEYLAHPVYLNAGEIPVGGRGKLGRTEFYMRFDAHTDYSLKTSENTKLKFVADFFNILNSTRIRQPQEFRELSAGVNNVDFLQPRSFYAPFNMRVGVRFEF